MKKYCFCTLSDDKFIKGTQVLLFSFLRFNKWFNGDIIVFYNTDFSNLSHKSKNDLLKIYKNIQFINCQKLEYQQIKIKYQNTNKQRFIQSLLTFEIYDLENYDRVVFMDSDILILGDIHKVFDNKHHFIGTEDDRNNYNAKSKLYKINTQRPYFNGGFVSIDLNILKQKHTKGLLSYALNADINHLYFEQYFSNEYFKDKTDLYLIEKKYNVLKRFWPNGKEEEIKTLLLENKPLGLHYVGGKPWTNTKDGKNYKFLNQLWINEYNLLTKINDITFVFAEFGDNIDLNPSFQSLQKYFPKAKYVLYTDKFINIKNVITKKVDGIFDKNHKRYGWRANDYWKVKGLLEADTEYAISFDTDMKIVSDDIKTILPLTKRFGCCLPANPRLLVKIDNTKGQDGDKKFNIIKGNGFIPNMSPITFYTSDKKTRKLLELYVDSMKSNPLRGPVKMWRAIWSSDCNPYLLPFQWCVCEEHLGIGNEIILHVGHDKVKNYYKDK